MKRIQSALLALAGTLAIGNTVFAQVNSVALKANIPFSFQAGLNMVQPGDYRIVRNGSLWRFSNVVTGEQKQVLISSEVEGKLTDRASLVFSCRADGSHCALRQINAGAGNNGAYWPEPKHNTADGNETARLVEIPANAAY
ncbi:MAG: hypothetical protein JO336_15395 [Acidobacteriia bacterium]|nr:hypothetical protein [Terriglobia bacterium]MBV8905235.1 hypothetical protein [Terriglobia bacterium]MBV9746502.1 hypothetical protein [Terriglobia bacterium]